MTRLLRYARLWFTLPGEERRMRAGRKVERFLRRSPAIRRLCLSPDHPFWWSLRLALRVDFRTAIEGLVREDPRRGPLRADLDARAREIAERHPSHADAVLEQARALVDRRFDLLGSGRCKPLLDDGRIDWHRDFKSGLSWDPSTHHLDIVAVRGDGSDVKVVWELSRFQHLAVLGQAYRFAPHRLDAREADTLRHRCAMEAKDQIDDWIVRNPRGLGVNWACTMDVAIRAVNWLAALALFRQARELDEEFLLRVLRSLWVHGRHIRRNLEIAPGGITSNHYLSDVVGLYALGCALPELTEADSWRSLGRRALTEEMDRQVLPDGADFERSIPYHRLVAELFIHGALHARCAGEPMPREWLDRLGGMLDFTAAYTRPDGSVPQWGDNDDGRLLPLDGYATHSPNDHRHLLALGARLLDRQRASDVDDDRDVEAIWLLGRGTSPKPAPDPAGVGVASRAFPSCGYHVMRAGDLHGAVSCGPVGTGGIGNHSHNDLLAVCIWAAGQEWIADPGTGCYTADPRLRNRLRSTAAHATLQLGEREQNDFGPGLDALFQMRDTAAPEVLEWWAKADAAYLSAKQRGYSDASAEWIHRREILFDANRRLWSIADTLSGVDAGASAAGEERVYLRYPIAPGVAARRNLDDGSWPDSVLDALAQRVSEPNRRREAVLLESGDARFWIALDLPAGSTVEIREGRHSPKYGIHVPCEVVVASAPPAMEVRAFSVLHSPSGVSR